MVTEYDLPSRGENVEIFGGPLPAQFQVEILFGEVIIDLYDAHACARGKPSKSVLCRCETDGGQVYHFSAHQAFARNESSKFSSAQVRVTF